MKKYIILLTIFLLFLNSVFSNNVKNSELYSLKREIDSLKIEQAKFEYQEGFFSQAIDAQKSFQSDILESYSNVISILFGLLGFLSLGGVILEIRSNSKKFKSESEKLDAKFEKATIEAKTKMIESVDSIIAEVNKKYSDIEIKQKEIFKQLNLDRGQLYYTFAKTIGEIEKKFPYLVISLKNYVLSEEIELSVDLCYYINDCFKEIIKYNKKLNPVDFNSTLNSIIEIRNALNEINDPENQLNKINPIIENILTSLLNIMPSK